MQHGRNECRKVTLNTGQVGYFHTWTKKAVQVNDDKTISVTAAIVELEDGKVVVVDPTDMTLDPRSDSQRRMDEVMEHLQERLGDS